MQSTTITSVEVCRRADVTYRQLDYWCRAGLLRLVSGNPNPGSGGDRSFDETEVCVVAVCGVLARLGARIPTLELVATAMRADPSLWFRAALFVNLDGRIVDDPWSDGWSVDLDRLRGIMLACDDCSSS